MCQQREQHPLNSKFCWSAHGESGEGWNGGQHWGGTGAGLGVPAHTISYLPSRSTSMSQHGLAPALAVIFLSWVRIDSLCRVGLTLGEGNAHSLGEAFQVLHFLWDAVQASVWGTLRLVMLIVFITLQPELGRSGLPKVLPCEFIADLGPDPVTMAP